MILKIIMIAINKKFVDMKINKCMQVAAYA